MQVIPQLVFAFPVNVTFEEASAALALHFGGTPVNLATGEQDEALKLRDASAVFGGGTAVLSVTTGANPANAAPSIELDAEGLPWDERIHSSSKAKNDNGNWKLKKGIANSNLLTQVKAELLSKRSGGAVATATLTVEPNAAQVSMTNDSDAAKEARITYAQDQAAVAAGPMTMLTNDQFEKLKKGQAVECLQAGLEWFDKWRHAFDQAYVQYGERAVQQSMPAAVETPQIDANSFAGFSVWYASSIAGKQDAAFNEVCGTLGVVGGLAGLATNPAMIPAVKALLATKGIV